MAQRASDHRAAVAALAFALACSPKAPAEMTPDAAIGDPGAPIADPLPGEPLAADLGLVLEELVTMPSSTPSPPAGDPRLQRRARINFLGEVPDGSGRLYVPDLNGRLYLIERGKPEVYLDVGAEFRPSFLGHRGLGSGFGFVAFHPEFARNGVFYTVHTEANAALTTRTPDLPSQDNPAHHGVLTEWTAEDPAADTFTGTRREVLRLGFRTVIHGFQEINFNPTARPGDEDHGLLYLAVGDGGAGVGGGDAQDLSKPHGKILRIDPLGSNGINGQYGIPVTNPFVARPDALGEIYAYGLRNPHRFSWDHGAPTRMFVGNIGEHNIEAIYEVKPGDNFGWTEREGPFLIKDGDPTCSVYPLPGNDPLFGYTYPVAAYDHDPPAGHRRCADSGDAVIGGFVYRGRLRALKGRYVFGDDVNGRLFYTNASDMRRGGKLATIHELAVFDAGGRRTSMQELAGDARVDLRFGRDAAGELYVLSKANGRIWKVVGVQRR